MSKAPLPELSRTRRAAFRELEHAIERVFILCHGSTITVDHLPAEIKDYAKETGTPYVLS
ncbi:MAG: hypothetical protein HWN68_03775 [Desulfobacterales bacterium]|nr:hypothetical protein [Desulfobacterales bacterium]